MENSLTNLTFEVNKYMSLKLEERKTVIYVEGEEFLHCKGLFIQVPLEEPYASNKNASVEEKRVSINDIAIKLTQHDRQYCYKISPKTEFWGHCSNLQAWFDNDYNTDLIDYHLGFALLKRLAEVGDPLAKKVFKEEILERYFYGSWQVQEFLVIEHYIDLVTDEEKYSLLEDEEELEAIIGIERELGERVKLDTPYNYFKRGMVLRKGIVTELFLRGCNLRSVPKDIKRLKNLRVLRLSHNLISELPDWIGELTKLESLNLSTNNLEEIPESIGALKSLKKLIIYANQLKIIPPSMSDLTSLEELDLHRNQIEALPDSIGNLGVLKKLLLSDNNLKSLPESMAKLTSLELLFLNKNEINAIPPKLKKLDIKMFQISKK